MFVMCWVCYSHNITVTLIYCAIDFVHVALFVIIFVHGLFVLILS